MQAEELADVIPISRGQLQLLNRLLLGNLIVELCKNVLGTSLVKFGVQVRVASDQDQLRLCRTDTLPCLFESG
jgi:hypothetical protein